MINFKLKNIDIVKLQNTAGVFIGQKNTHKKYFNESLVNEVVGAVSGNENLVRENYWLVTKKGEE